jgi:nicotinamidase-related amidase
MQNDYFPDGKMEVDGAVKASENAKKLLAKFREEKLTCIHIQHISIREGASFFLPDSQGTDIHKNVAPVQTEIIIQKNFPNSFRETDLEKNLKINEIDTVVICGMMSQMCIDATTRAAFDKGYKCIVAHDACAAISLSFNGSDIPSGQVHGAFMAA